MFQRIRDLDNRIVDGVTLLHRPALNRLMIFFTRAGSLAAVWWLCACLPFLITKKYRMAGINLALALVITYVVGEIIIKRIIARQRPSDSIHEDDMIVKKPKDYSFPSGHTASSFTAFTVILLYCPVYFSIPALLVASTIGFSRVYLRVHFLSDVIAGAVLGTVLGVLSVVLFRAVLM